MNVGFRPKGVIRQLRRDNEIQAYRAWIMRITFLLRASYRTDEPIYAHYRKCCATGKVHNGVSDIGRVVLDTFLSRVN